MDPDEVNQSVRVRPSSARAWVVFLVLALAFSYLLLLPLVRPRGALFGGYYGFKDIFFGIPIALAMLCSIVVFIAPARYRRPIGFRLATICVSTVLALFVLDLVYAFGVTGAWQPNYWLDQAHIPRKYSAADDELGFVRKPGVSWSGVLPGANKLVDYRTDANGFRNPPGIQHADIVFIGDSYTEAASVPESDSFVNRVAESSGLSVVNLGRGAYGPQQELIVLRRYGLAFHPRVVVWQLFEGNDLSDARIFAEWKKAPTEQTVSFKERYLNNSFIAEWLNKTRAPDPSVPTVKLQESDGTVKTQLLRYKYDRLLPASEPLGMEETSRAIEAGLRLCQSQGIKLVVVNVPTMLRVMQPYLTFTHDEDRNRYLPNGVTGGDDIFIGQTSDFCRKIGCPFIDAFTALREAADAGNRNLYIPYDEHLDIEGHRVIAQTVFDWLRTQRLVGSEAAGQQMRTAGQ